MFSNVSTQIGVLVSEFISIKVQGKKLKKLPVRRVNIVIQNDIKNCTYETIELV